MLCTRHCAAQGTRLQLACQVVVGLATWSRCTPDRINSCPCVVSAHRNLPSSVQAMSGKKCSENGSAEHCINENAACGVQALPCSKRTIVVPLGSRIAYCPLLGLIAVQPALRMGSLTVYLAHVTLHQDMPSTATATSYDCRVQVSGDRKPLPTCAQPPSAPWQRQIHTTTSTRDGGEDRSVNIDPK